MLILFLVLGAVSATDISNVSITEDSNLEDNDDSLSTQNKLEISSEDSISETNIVNSHDDNLKDYPIEETLQSSDDSNYEDNDGKLQASNDVISNNGDSDILTGVSDNDIVSTSVSDNDVIAISLEESDILSADSKVSTSLSVSDTHYSKSATFFKITLKDADGKVINSQKVSLKVNGKSYSGVTDKNGIASIKTNALAIGTYTVSLTYAGNSKYSASSLSKKVKVLSSVKGSDLTKYDGYISTYTATFWKNNDVLANTKVNFKINGVTYTRTTDKNGVAKLAVNLPAGKYVVSSTNPYSGEKLSNNVIIKKDTTTLTHGSTKTYIIPNTKYTFTVTLKTKHNVLLEGKKIEFTYNNKKVTAVTNKNGKASITIPALSKGTYKITYKYDGNKRFSSSSESGYLYVKDSSVKLTSSQLKMSYKDGSKFTVKLTNSNGKALENKNIKFKLNGKSSTVKTDSEGKAKLDIGNLKPGTYKVTYTFSKKGASDYNTRSNKVIISKKSVSLSADNLNMKYKDGSSFKVTVKDNSGKLLKNVKVKITINGKTYTRTTNKNGVAKQEIGLEMGTYKVKSVVSSSVYKSSTITKKVVIGGTKIVGEDLYVPLGSGATYSVKVITGKSTPVKNTKVTFTCNGKTYEKTTNSNGIAKVSLGKLSKGTYKIKYTDGSYSDSSKIHVVDKVTIKQIVASSKNVKKYIEKNHKLPSTVTIGNIKYSTAEYMYLASKAIVNLKANNKDSITVKDIKSPTKAVGASDMGNLNDYLSAAKSVVKTADSKGIMPNSVSTKVGTVGYNGLVYAFARVNAFYGDNGRMPSYVSIDSLSASSSSSSALNPKNTIEDLTAYLAASANCQVNNAKIKELVTKLTKNCKTDKEKATAIFNYVRDTLDYSFYYNTKYGAVGALNAKTGNCVDHSHLLVAMYRTAGLAARYAHGSCTFSSGSTYGHVWSQVLIGDTWTVSDATSSRNSLGSVANWNTNTYKLYSYSSSISF